MKVAYLAESPADAAALKILTEGVLGKATQPASHVGLEHRGWPTVRTIFPTVIKQLHYHTDAEGFVLVVDANGSPPHQATHNPPGPPEPQCRLCQLRGIVEMARGELRPRADRPLLRIAVGLAVPTIEAWLLCGADPHVTEAAWINGLKEGPMPYTKTDLKRRLYGTSRPSLALETEVMTKAANRLAQNLAVIENLFPAGFGAFASVLRSW